MKSYRVQLLRKTEAIDRDIKLKTAVAGSGVPAHQTEEARNPEEPQRRHDAPAVDRKDELHEQASVGQSLRWRLWESPPTAAAHGGWSVAEIVCGLFLFLLIYKR